MVVKMVVPVWGSLLLIKGFTMRNFYQQEIAEAFNK